MHIRHIVPAVAVLAVVGAAAPAAQAASTHMSSTSASSNTRSVSRQLEVSVAKTESDAYLQYAGYADGALKSGRPDLADVWQSVGKVGHQDHWTHEVTLAGLYSGSDNIANLRTAITQAQQAAKVDTSWAARAPKGSAAAAELRTGAARETADAPAQAGAHRRAGQGPAALRPLHPHRPHPSDRDAALFRDLLQRRPDGRFQLRA